MIVKKFVQDLYLDATNPRQADDARLSLLRLSIAKLGFIMPVYCTAEGMLLSGHQRITVARQLQIATVPAIVIDVADKDIKGINVLFNRATNDFSAFDTGGSSKEAVSMPEVLAAAEALEDYGDEHWLALDCKNMNIRGLAKTIHDRYDKKAANTASALCKQGIRIPIVVSESGQVVNGIHRLIAAREDGISVWPVITIPDAMAEVAVMFLNYLSMDYKVDADYADLMRYSAYRRPQNNRGVVPKAYRFWANGHRTLPDKDSYTADYWRKFRDLHGHNIIDFGAGLGKVAPFLQSKGMACIDFEPYRIDPDKGNGVPDPDYSKRKAAEFLAHIADGRQFDSIFLASVMNSIPFPEDRLKVLAIIHGLSTFSTAVYGTCRDMSDFNYEYGGIRNANYFVFDSEPGVRIGDVMRNPKIQKFETQDSARAVFSRFWNKIEFWPGGNIFYFKLSAPKRISPAILGKSLDFEFGELPYADGTTIDLADAAKEAFSRRLKVHIP